MAIHTLADALFPNPHNETLGLDLQEAEDGSPGIRPRRRRR